MHAQAEFACTHARVHAYVCARMFVTVVVVVERRVTPESPLLLARTRGALVLVGVSPTGVAAASAALGTAPTDDMPFGVTDASAVISVAFAISPPPPPTGLCNIWKE